MKKLTLTLILSLTLLFNGCKDKERIYKPRREYKVICPNIGTFEIYEMYDGKFTYYYADKNNTTHHHTFP